MVCSLFLILNITFLFIVPQCDTESDQDEKVSQPFAVILFHILLSVPGSLQASCIGLQ